MQIVTSHTILKAQDRKEKKRKIYFVRRKKPLPYLDSDSRETVKKHPNIRPLVITLTNVVSIKLVINLWIGSFNATL